MANDMFIKRLILIIFSLVLAFLSFSSPTKKFTEFSIDFPTYLSELGEFMTATDNDKLKSVYKKFSKQSKSLTKVEKSNIIQISNKMLSKRLRAKPHFSNFLLSVTKVTNSQIVLDDWLKVVEATIDHSTSKKLLSMFIFSADLVTKKILRSSKTAEWKVSNTNFYFSFEVVEPVLIFDTPFNLTCKSDNGSYTIYDTKGKYFFLSSLWQGNNGMINWQSYGLSKDSVYAEINLYNIDTRKTEIFADSTIFHNKYIFDKPILGHLLNGIYSGKKSNLFPKFTSFSKNIRLEEIFPNIDYSGGYLLQGNEFVADGGNYAEAKIIFKRNEKDVFVANANRFSIDSDKIVAKESGVKIFFNNDSIYHGNLQFKYIDSERRLQLYRIRNGLSGAPMLNTFHNLTMDFELLEWYIDTEIITFGSLPGSAESRVEFESVDRYLESKFESMQGIDAIHPLILVKNYTIAKNHNQFYVKDFARFAKFPLVQIQHYLIRLANDGFIYYNFDLQQITVLPKLFNYVNAASDISDYDVISFKSIIKSGEYNTGDKNLVNAALNLETKDLNIIGIGNIRVSKERGVYLYPRNGLIIVKKNRDFIFNGQVFAGHGRLNLFGRKFKFHYDDFKVDLNYIDSVQLAVPIQPMQKDKNDHYVLTPIKTVIEAVKGDLRIDDPSNKSGIRADSFPQFPVFRSFEDSYVYYDRKSIYDGVYNRDRFSFHLEPFEIDSIDDYNGKGLYFSGSFQSSGIFPTFFDTLRLQKDYSLGFIRKTPRDGFDIYGGKAKYYNDILLSHDGLKGNGEFEYLSAKASSNDILFFPDSTNLYTQSFLINEIIDGIEFPEVRNNETYAHFEPYNDRLDIYRINEEFDFYKSQATFKGDLLMRPTGLTGGGVMSLENAKVTANLLSYNANWFSSDTASLRVFEESGILAFKANDLKTHIDLGTREGIFYSNGIGSYVELPANDYISYIDKLKWSMDNESLSLGDEDSNNDGSKFISVHVDQDSLSFSAKTAFYSLKDYIIHAFGVEELIIADAIIYPDSGKLTVAKMAVIETLYAANIITDSSTKYHKFFNATVDIMTAHNYLASGDYIYKYDNNNEQYIFFEEIKVNKDTITVAKGEVDKDKIFQLNTKFDFKGRVDLISDQKNLTYDGYFMVNHDCVLLDKQWIKFRSKIDPDNIVFILDEKIYSEDNLLLSTSLNISHDSTEFYSTFLSPKKNATLDISILSASYTLKYDNNKFAYTVGGPDELSNYFTLYDKTCKNYGEGFVNLGVNLGQVSLQSIGNINHDMLSNETDFEGFLIFDFFFSDDAMLHMADRLHESKDYEDFEYDDLFSKNLSRVIGKERAQSEIDNLELTEEYTDFPDQMKHSFVFAKTKLQWDNINKAYISKGPIAVHSIMGKHLNATHPGYIIIEKGQNSDVLTIYLDTDYEYKYYFQFKNGVMQTWSDNPDFEIEINDISIDKRKADRKKGIPAYRYMFVSEEVAEKSLKNLIKKY